MGVTLSIQSNCSSGAIIRALPLAKPDDLRAENSDIVKRIEVGYNDSTNLVESITWPLKCGDDGLHGMVKRRKGQWDRTRRSFVFPTGDLAEEAFAAIRKRHPDWHVLGHPKYAFQPLAGLSITRIELSGGLAMCLTPAHLPNVLGIHGQLFTFRLFSAGASRAVGLLIGLAAEIGAAVDSMIDLGANLDESLARQWPTIGAREVAVKVRTSGWTVELECDLSNPIHYLIDPPQARSAESSFGPSQNGYGPWLGGLYSTRRRWPELKAKLAALAVAWTGDDPDSKLVNQVEFDVARVPGWRVPAPNGHLLHKYQKEGALFCGRRGMRALIGDEMGVGKTAQAIAAIEAAGTPRIFVVCPANARFVWDREIREWGALGKTQHIRSKLDSIDVESRWHILTYDLLAARAETWTFSDEDEIQAVLDTFPQLSKSVQRTSRGQNKPDSVRLKLTTVLNGRPRLKPMRLRAWDRMMKRLEGQLASHMRRCGQALFIFDEAHRLKNADAKRTQSIAALLGPDAQTLLLTGTPIRNHESEVANLLSLLDPAAAAALSPAKGYTLADLQDYLRFFMIRRTKAQVLPQLPEKTRQRLDIDIDELDEVELESYFDALACAHQRHDRALEHGKTMAEARQAFFGMIELARIALALAKVASGAVADIVQDIVDSSGSCVVFCAHHQVIDTLMAQLRRRKLNVSVVDGRKSQGARSAEIQCFQEGRSDVFIGSINAAGEAITLTRSSTVVFVELDWVPAALLQAEDRVHRVGQQSRCHIIQILARIDGPNLDEVMARSIDAKVQRIGHVFNESVEAIIEPSSAGVKSVRELVISELLDPSPSRGSSA